MIAELEDIIFGMLKYRFTVKRAKRYDGLTLIELIIVMTILVLITLVVVPSFVTATKNSQVRTTVQQLSSIFRYARAKAVSNGRLVLVEFKTIPFNTVRVLLPSGVEPSQQELNFSDQSPTIPDWTDEEWRYLSGERLERLDPQNFTEDLSPMGRQRQLPEVLIKIIKTTQTDRADLNNELNIVVFYPDGTSSGESILVKGEHIAFELKINSATGEIIVNEVDVSEIKGDS